MTIIAKYAGTVSSLTSVIASYYYYLISALLRHQLPATFCLETPSCTGFIDDADSVPLFSRHIFSAHKRAKRGQHSLYFFRRLHACITPTDELMLSRRQQSIMLIEADMPLCYYARYAIASMPPYFTTLGY